jgi:hypothetical protein
MSLKIRNILFYNPKAARVGRITWGIAPHPLGEYSTAVSSAKNF